MSFMIFLLFLLLIVAESTVSVSISNQVNHNHQVNSSPCPGSSPNDSSSQTPHDDKAKQTNATPRGLSSVNVNKLMSSAHSSCKYFPEIVLVQDASSSYKDDLDHLAKMMPDLLNYFKDKFQGFAKFGITSFGDKPEGNRAGINDYCAEVHLPLTLMNTKSAMRETQRALRDLIAAGNRDYIEGGNEALFRVAASDEVGWSKGTHDKATGLPIGRIVILSTDAPVHDPGEKSLLAHDLRSPENHEILNREIDYRCGLTDYPTPEDIRHVMQERNIVPVIIVGDFHYVSETGQKLHYDPYEKLLQRYQNISKPWEDFDDGPIDYYEWYMKNQAGIDSAVVERIHNRTSSTYTEAFEDAMARATNQVCSIIKQAEQNRKVEENQESGSSLRLIHLVLIAIAAVVVTVIISVFLFWKCYDKVDDGDSLIKNRDPIEPGRDDKNRNQNRNQNRVITNFDDEPIW